MFFTLVLNNILTILTIRWSFLRFCALRLAKLGTALSKSTTCSYIFSNNKLQSYAWFIVLFGALSSLLPLVAHIQGTRLASCCLVVTKLLFLSIPSIHLLIFSNLMKYIKWHHIYTLKNLLS